jgi:hypothetical protein
MIPNFQNGVLPPFIGNPANNAARSPYLTDPVELVTQLGGSPRRNQILAAFFKFRRDIHAAGIIVGGQWIDGSFVEDKAPNDIDVVTFFRRPAGLPETGVEAFVTANSGLFSPASIKANYLCDAYWVDLDALPAENLVQDVCYWFGLFTHQRQTLRWKGILDLPLGNPTSDKHGIDELERLQADDKR